MLLKNNRFREILRKEVYLQKLTFKELARLAEIPYRTMITYISQENCYPGIDNAYKLSEVLNVSLDYLVTGVDRFRSEKMYSGIDITLHPMIEELSELAPEEIRSIQNLIHTLYMERRKLNENC